MNCNVIIAGFFSGCNLNAYRLRLAVWCLVMALHPFVLWISERTRIEAVGPVRVFLLLAGVPGALYSAVLGSFLFVGIICRLFGFQSLMSLLHSNSGYDWPVWTARNRGGKLTLYWLIIPAITVQKAHKRLKTNKTFILCMENY